MDRDQPFDWALIPHLRPGLPTRLLCQNSSPLLDVRLCTPASRRLRSFLHPGHIWGPGRWKSLSSKCSWSLGLTEWG